MSIISLPDGEATRRGLRVRLVCRHSVVPAVVQLLQDPLSPGNVDIKRLVYFTACVNFTPEETVLFLIK